MRYTIVGLALCLWMSCGISRRQLRSGDLIYQNLECGPLCDAIEIVTAGKEEYAFSHIGLLENADGNYYIWESIGQGVQRTPLDSFLARSPNTYYVSRLKNAYQKSIIPALDFVRQKEGLAYDDEFLYDNGKYYCSELLYDAFAVTELGTIYVLEPMTFVDKTDSMISKIWQAYYSKLGMKVPENQLGINPAGIARSPKNKWLRKLKI